MSKSWAVDGTCLSADEILKGVRSFPSALATSQLGAAPNVRISDLMPIMGQEGCHGSRTEVYRLESGGFGSRAVAHRSCDGVMRAQSPPHHSRAGVMIIPVSDYLMCAALNGCDDPA